MRVAQKISRDVSLCKNIDQRLRCVRYGLYGLAGLACAQKLNPEASACMHGRWGTNIFGLASRGDPEAATVQR